MNIFSKILISAAVITMLSIPFAYQAGAVAPGPKVSELSSTNGGNKHNLSAKVWAFGTVNHDPSSFTATNPNTYKATGDTTGNPKGQQICIFCHTPHNANVEGGAPLWNRRFSTVTFSRYSSATLQIRVNSAARTPAKYDDTSTPAWQPDGSSKLCLSCHDGVASLGDVLSGGPIAMTNDVISGIASFNPSTNKMKTGHHPISFVYNSAVATAINKSYQWPPSLTEVKLDKNGKMQCTTCHDAHQNQTNDDQCYNDVGDACDVSHTRKKAPFWVYGPGSLPVPGSGDAPTDRDAVCTACHNVAPGTLTTPSWP